VFKGIHHDHAELERLSYDFIAERAETDDPIRGYVIRTDDEMRRLQGFCWYTTFTTYVAPAQHLYPRSDASRV
jgi:hypothetical protein